MKDELAQSRGFLMGLATVAVVFFHQQWFVDGIAFPLHRLGYWGVDVFLFVSGFGCVYALRKTESVTSFLQRRVWRIMPTCIVLGLMVWLADQWLDVEKIDTAAVWRIANLHMWYIPCILMAYVLCPLIYRLLQRFGLWALLPLCLVTLAVSQFMPWGMPGAMFVRPQWILQRLPVFFIGIYVATYNVRVSRAGYALSALAACLGAVYVCIGGVKEWVWVFFVACGVLALCKAGHYMHGWSKRIGVAAVVETIGAYSLEAYLSHPYILKWLETTDMNRWMKMLVLVVLIVAMSYVAKRVVGALEWAKRSVKLPARA